MLSKGHGGAGIPRVVDKGWCFTCISGAKNSVGGSASVGSFQHSDGKDVVTVGQQDG